MVFHIFSSFGDPDINYITSLNLLCSPVTASMLLVIHSNINKVIDLDLTRSRATETPARTLLLFSYFKPLNNSC